MPRILRREALSDSTFLWVLDAPDIARAARPGQFVMVRSHEGGERIPLTLADFDATTITLVIQAVGRSTREMADTLRVGDDVLDVAGPLGLPAHTPKVGHVVLVGGGLGVAPVFPQLRAFRQAGNRITTILGFRTESLTFWEERFATWSDRVIVCTDDGSHGRKGLVTDALSAVIAEDPPDRVVAIGPLPMMRACAAVTGTIPTFVSLNAIMVDGTGMCGSCRVTVGGEVRFACVDGPDFDAHAVDFDGLLRRQSRFATDEAAALADHTHVCRLDTLLNVEGRHNYQKIPQLPPRATPMPERPAAERARTFDEVNLGYDLGAALQEAERCIQCSRPACVSGCPVGVDIPGFIRQLLVRDLDGAAAVIRAHNLFPSVCGRVCPQESQCEAQCILAKKIEPVAIGRLERFVGDHAGPAQAPPIAPRAGRVAVVGSGPAGLACAAELAAQGVEVIVFEALHVLGGVLRYGIPAFRLPRDVLERELDQLRALGVSFRTNVIVGRTFTVPQLQAEFDAVFLGVGAGYPTMLGIPGEDAGGVLSANELLTRVNLMGGDRFPYAATPVGLGRRVVVVGAGNTAMDCLRVARRLGAEAVHCVYRRTEAEAPARREELRHATEEGIRFHWLRSPTAILTDAAGRVTGVRLDVMRLGPPDASGRRKPEPTGEVEELPCDTVVTALGTRANPILSQTTPGLRLHHGGYVQADAVTQATSEPGVFAGGDIVTGGATVILALGAGRRAARAVLAWLDTRVWPPSVPEEVAQSTPTVLRDTTCPRCHRPVDEPGYVCCAEAPLSWSCAGCHQHFEGYAFPHGRCPSCGGALVLGAPEDSDAAAVREAVQVELGGLALYQTGALHATDKGVRDLFSRLAAMEHDHLLTLRRRHHLVTVAGDAAAGPVYAGVTLPMEDPAALLRCAIELERRAQEFFTAREAAAMRDSPAWRLYRAFAAEEAEHAQLLELELARRTAGRAGWL